MKKYICILLLIFCMQKIEAQMYGAGELLLSPSVTSNGMAETGVAFVDEKSMYYNPAALALFAKENRITTTGFPKRSAYYADLTFYNSSLSFPFQRYTPDSKLLFALGGYYSSLKIGPYEETTPLYPEGTGRFFQPHLKNYNFIFSAAYICRFHVSVGLTYKRIKQTVYEVESKGSGFDAGLLIQLPFQNKDKELYTYFKPAFGVAVRNMGELEASGYLFAETVNRPSLSIKSDLPKTKSFGFNFEFGIIDRTNLVKEIFKFSPSFTLVKLADFDFYNRIGFEAQIYKAIAFRLGFINNDRYENTTTKGFSFDTGHFLLMLKPSLAKRPGKLGYFFSKVLLFKYSYSDNSDDFSDHDLSISFSL